MCILYNLYFRTVCNFPPGLDFTETETNREVEIFLKEIMRELIKDFLSVCIWFTFLSYKVKIHK